MKHYLRLICVMCAVTGCASVEFHQLKEEKASQRPQQEEREGLVVSCEPISSAQEVEYFLGLDLLDAGILPVVVYLENRGSADTFTFVPEEMELRYEDAAKLAHVPWKAVYEEICFSYWRSFPGFFFLIFPGFIISHSVSVANESLSQQYDRIALQKIALPPGERAQGVVFLKPAGDFSLPLTGLCNADLRLMFQRKTGQRTVSEEVLYHLYMQE